MLNNWELVQNLSLVHLDHARIDLAPQLYARDLEQHWRVLVEWASLGLIANAEKRQEYKKRSLF